MLTNRINSLTFLSNCNDNNKKHTKVRMFHVLVSVPCFVLPLSPSFNLSLFSMCFWQLRPLSCFNILLHGLKQVRAAATCLLSLTLILSTEASQLVVSVGREVKPQPVLAADDGWWQIRTSEPRTEDSAVTKCSAFNLQQRKYKTLQAHLTTTWCAV